MSEQSYHQFCPVAMASELLCTRWTMIVLRELMCGPARFNELRRGMPRMSPALLSRRLKELEDAGVVERRPLEHEAGGFEYCLTPAGEEIRPLVEGMGRWGQRWVSGQLSLQMLDAQLLMWDMRRRLQIDAVPGGCRVIQFLYPDAPPRDRKWWLVVRPGEPVDLCSVDPGLDIDLFVHSPLRTMTEIWMGLATVAAARDQGLVQVAGDERLAAGLQRWLGLSPFAVEPKLVA